MKHHLLWAFTNQNVFYSAHDILPPLGVDKLDSFIPLYSLLFWCIYYPFLLIDASFIYLFPPLVTFPLFYFVFKSLMLRLLCCLCGFCFSLFWRLEKKASCGRGSGGFNQKNNYAIPEAGRIKLYSHILPIVCECRLMLNESAI